MTQHKCPTCQQRTRPDGSGLESELTTWLEAEAEQYRKTRNEWFLKIERLEAERDEWKWEYHNSCEFRYDLDAKIEKLEAEIAVLREALEKIKERNTPGYDNDTLGMGIIDPDYKIACEALTRPQAAMVREVVRAPNDLEISVPVWEDGQFSCVGFQIDKDTLKQFYDALKKYRESK